MRSPQTALLLGTLLAVGCTDQLPTGPAAIEATVSLPVTASLIIGETVVMGTPDVESYFSFVECPLGGDLTFTYAQKVLIRTPGSSGATAHRAFSYQVLTPGQRHTVTNAWDCGNGFQMVEAGICGCIIIALEGAAIAQPAVGTAVGRALPK